MPNAKITQKINCIDFVSIGLYVILFFLGEQGVEVCLGAEYSSLLISYERFAPKINELICLHADCLCRHA